MGGAPLLRHRLLINVQGDPAVGMPKQLLGEFYVNSVLPEKRCESMAKRVPADSLSDVQTFQRRPYVTPQDHLRLQRLFPFFKSDANT